MSFNPLTLLRGIDNAKSDCGPSILGFAMTIKNDDMSNDNTPAGNSTKIPVWADGLRQLYNEVLEEPLPDDFSQLLKKLDESSDG